MDQPHEPVRPDLPPQGDIGDPVAIRAFLLAAFLIVAAMVLWAFAMIGY